MQSIKHLNHPRFCILVERSGDKRKHCFKAVPTKKAIIARAGTEIKPLREIYQNATILDQFGDEIHATGEFYVASESINQYFLVFDIF